MCYVQATIVSLETIFLSHNVEMNNEGILVFIIIILGSARTFRAFPELHHGLVCLCVGDGHYPEELGAPASLV